MASNNSSTTDTEKKLICTCCGNEKKKTDFYESGNYMFRNLGRLTICKSCLDIYFNQKLFENNNDDIAAIYSVCQLINIPYYKSIYSGAASQLEKSGWKTPPYRIYIQKFNSMKKANSYPENFFESDNPNGENLIELFDDEIEDVVDFDKCVVTQSDVIFWGKRYSKDDIKFLKYRYEQWITKHKSDELAEQVLFKQICIVEMEIEKDRDAKKNVDKKIDLLQKLMTSANVKPSDQKSINTSENQNALGVWIKDIEKYRPAEYFKDKKLYFDFDGIKDYFQRFILRPLKNLLTGSRDFDVEYNVLPDGINSTEVKQGDTKDD